MHETPAVFWLCEATPTLEDRTDVLRARSRVTSGRGGRCGCESKGGRRRCRVLHPLDMQAEAATDWFKSSMEMG
jgi:hypothetical protein